MANDRAGLEQLNALSITDVRIELRKCCGSTAWIDGMVAARPFATLDELFEAADRVWDGLEEPDWREAFDAHPKIGEKKAVQEQSETASRWSTEEQAGMSQASTDVVQRLADANQRYFDRFGFIFIVCASGKSAGVMLALLEERLSNPRDEELRIAAVEQGKITRLRLDKWLK